MLTYESFNYNLGKYMAWAFSKYVTSASSFIKDSFNFKCNLNQLNHKALMASFDVISFFTEIPTAEACKIASELYIRDSNPSIDIPSNQLATLIELTTIKTNFMFNNPNYIQTNGLSMGNPVSPVLANIFMTQVETQAVNTALHPPLYWYRYVDGTVAGFTSTEHKLNFFNHINATHPNINFICEQEESNQISFLNLKITKTDTQFKTEIHRKITHTGLYIPWDSAHETKQKLNILRNQINTAIKLCLPDKINDELDKIKQYFININKFPPQTSENIIRTHSDRKQNQSTKVNISHQSENHQTIYCCIPYIPDISRQITNIWQKLVTKYDIPVNTKFIQKPGTKLRSILCKGYTDKHHTNIIYKIQCDNCHDFYIGETSRKMETRFKEHKNSPSHVFEHRKSNKHNITMENTQILNKETNAKLKKPYLYNNLNPK
ncbi:uncharacterized protein LOC143246349 isoform X1 [Tachypleus tridentatus]|uniref:uncharacterized protein LOC143246349 isoform X1 n=1 Tax=Tachypleus tridentatus TaxID=6853 RepID=UPI003FD1E890